MTQTVLLGDEIDLIGGGTPKTTTNEFWGGNIPWLSVVDFGGDARWVHSAEKTITELGLEKSSTKLLDPGDIIISARGTVGELAQLTQPMAFNQSCYGVRSRGSIDQNYLYYLLKHSISDLQRQAHGGVFSTITRETFRHIKVAPPDIKTQKKIADILGTLDEKIELNRQMNETLEQMGQALFRHHFIDNPEAEKWEAGQLDHLFEVTMGQSPPGSSYNDHGEGITFYQGRAEFGVRFPNKRLSTVDPKRLAKKGDTLLSVRAPVGDINQATEDCCVGRGLAAISSKAGQTSFCYYLCKNLQARFAEYNSEGTVFGAINGKQLKSLKVKLPAANAIGEFEDQASKIDEQIFNNAQQIQTLTTLRDTLLPRLISGKVKV